MNAFTNRSYQKELLDRDDIPFEHIKQNMQELDKINHYLGGHKITLRGLQSVVRDLPADNLRVIKQWAQRNGQQVHLTGIDINEECIRYAQSIKANAGIRFLHSDYKQVEFSTKPQVIFSSLFCHHFPQGELIYMLQWMKQNTEMGFFINDLHRHPLAYYSIKVLTQWLSRSYLVKNDAPLSVQRGFIRVDWEELFAKAGIKNFTCRWQWAFRWLVTYLHTDEPNRTGI
jgi:hypothetical protein